MDPTLLFQPVALHLRMILPHGGTPKRYWTGKRGLDEGFGKNIYSSVLRAGDISKVVGIGKKKKKNEYTLDKIKIKTPPVPGHVFVFILRIIH